MRLSSLTRPFRSAHKLVPRPLRRFSRDRRGVTAVEFGLVSVPFFGLLMAIFQAGFFFFASEGLEAAVQDAARNLYTGIAQGNNVTTAAAFLSTYVCPANAPRKLPSFLDCTKLIVDVRTATSFGAANTDADFYQSGSTTKFCPGGPGDIVIVRMIYPLPVVAPTLTTSNGKNVGVLRTGYVNDVPGNSGWKQLILGTSVFKNEPYSNGAIAAGTCS